MGTQATADPDPTDVMDTVSIVAVLTGLALPFDADGNFRPGDEHQSILFRARAVDAKYDAAEGKP